MLPDTLGRFGTSRDMAGLQPRFSATGIILILLATTLLTSCSRTTNMTAGSDAEEPTGTLAVIDGTPLEIDEFLTQFKRSASVASPEPTDSLAEYQDFLDRYVGFRDCGIVA